MIPPMGEASLAVLDRLDGLLLPGSPSNIHPSHYDGGDSLTPDRHDLERDATTLRLIPEALARGIPLLAICPRHPGAERRPRRHAASEGA
jgi:putative glutamine amidotransferase